MPEMLVLSNPRRRRRASAKKSKRRTVRAHSNPVHRKRRVRRNPSRAVASIKRRIRHVAHAGKVHRRRRIRRNPIGGSLRGMMGGSTMKMLKDAAVGGVGGIAVDFIMAKVANMLPLSMQPVAGEVGVYDAVRALATVAAGRVLSKTTKGLSMKMAEGALVVQAYQIAQTLMTKYAPSAAAATAVQGIGYASPQAIRRGTHRVSPILRLSGAGGMGMFTSPATRSPLLASAGEFTPGRSPLLAASRRSAMRHSYGRG